jgi:hypothetical protein
MILVRELGEIKRELVQLLGISQEEAELYIEAIGGTPIGPRTLTNPRKKDAVSGLSAKGMVIRAGKKKKNKGDNEFIPVHPRLALSNLFRIYDEKVARERKERRLSVDRLTLELIPIYERAKSTNVPPSPEEANNENERT